MRRTFIAIALTALAFIPSAQALYNKTDHTVEADNGEVYEILYTVHDPKDGHAEAHILTADNKQINFIFSCEGHMIISHGFNSSNWSHIPPRSVAARISQIACNGPGPFPRKS